MKKISILLGLFLLLGVTSISTQTPEGDFVPIEKTSIEVRVKRLEDEMELRRKHVKTKFLTVSNDMVFINNGSGIAFGELNVNDNTDATTFAGTGVANKVQYTEFDTIGESNNVTVSHSNDDLTIIKTGKYLIVTSIHVESSGAGARKIGFQMYKNNGQTALTHIHAHRNMAGGGGDVGSIHLSGIGDFSANDTIELWIWNETNTNSVILEDVTLSILQIGG